jgi:hypothetical protein
MPKSIAVYGNYIYQAPVKQRYWKRWRDGVKQRYWKRRRDGVKQRYWKIKRARGNLEPPFRSALAR